MSVGTRPCNFVTPMTVASYWQLSARDIWYLLLQPMPSHIIGETSDKFFFNRDRNLCMIRAFGSDYQAGCSYGHSFTCVDILPHRPFCKHIAGGKRMLELPSSIKRLLWLLIFQWIEDLSTHAHNLSRSSGDRVMSSSLVTILLIIQSNLIMPVSLTGR